MFPALCGKQLFSMHICLERYLSLLCSLQARWHGGDCENQMLLDLFAFFTF